MQRAVQSLATLSLVVAASVATVAGADDVASCPLPHGVKLVPALGALPRVVQDAVTDSAVLLPPPGAGHQLSFIWSEGRRWLLATRPSNDDYHDTIYVYVLSKDHRRARLAESAVTTADGLCEVARERIAYDRHRDNEE
jgi:hypothetical protein